METTFKTSQAVTPATEETAQALLLLSQSAEFTISIKATAAHPQNPDLIMRHKFVFDETNTQLRTAFYNIALRQREQLRREDGSFHKG